MSSNPLHVVIIGGGIGGLCLAHGLKAAGVSATVYERNSNQVWPEGYRIHINPLGAQALHACLPSVLWEAFVAAAGQPPAGLGFLTEQLQKMVVIAEEFMSSRVGNAVSAHYPVSRIALRHLLLAGMEDTVHFNKTFERYEYTREGKVVAHFTDGASAVGDILVGADGANSRVRQQYLPHAPRVEIGVIGIGGKLPLSAQTLSWLPRQLTTRLNLIMPADRYCLFTAPFEHRSASDEALNTIRERARAAHLDPDHLIDNSEDYMLWAFIARDSDYPPDMPLHDEQGLLQLVSLMIKGWHPVLHRIIAETPLMGVSLNPFKASTLVGPWEHTHVTLLGDAIHNMPPVGGLGANMALRDAWSLTRALVNYQRGSSSLLQAIQTYEVEMRRYGFAAVRASLGYTHQAITNRRLERQTSRAWYRLCQAVPPLKRVFEDIWTKPMHSTQ